LGHTVAVARAGAEGVALAMDFRSDVVLCDVGRPGGVDGAAGAREIRAGPDGATRYPVALELIPVGRADRGARRDASSPRREDEGVWTPEGSTQRRRAPRLCRGRVQTEHLGKCSIFLGNHRWRCERTTSRARVGLRQRPLGYPIPSGIGCEVGSRYPSGVPGTKREHLLRQLRNPSSKARSPSVSPRFELRGSCIRWCGTSNLEATEAPA
jgi:hypothetical protein